jgi:hypothetical protein
MVITLVWRMGRVPRNRPILWIDAAKLNFYGINGDMVTGLLNMKVNKQ